jgi:hypothetical protein
VLSPGLQQAQGTAGRVPQNARSIPACQPGALKRGGGHVFPAGRGLWRKITLIFLVAAGGDNTLRTSFWRKSFD